MKVHIYNPEHDTCLARDVEHFVVPKTALAMRARYDHIPAYWADDGDWVVVGDIASAQARLDNAGRRHAAVDFVTLDTLATLSADALPTALVPWGWDRNIAHTLRTANPLLTKLIPPPAALRQLRQLSSRVFTAHTLLPQIIGGAEDIFVGQMTVFDGSVEALSTIVAQHGQLVLKAPWSNSGKGVRFVGPTLTANDHGWARHVLHEQGALIIEPRYDKLQDCAMEFTIDAQGAVQYLGLSIFSTKGGTYQGNLLATERRKRQIIEQYVPAEHLAAAQQRVAAASATALAGRYHGPFGVDMMVVRTARGNALHPCVELNLRYTMGHAMLIG